MNGILLRAPATIANFGPGFDIFALALEQPYDLFRVRRNTQGNIKVMVSGQDEGLPVSPEDNTAGLAAIHFFKTMGIAGGVDIEIIKRMRSCAGLGTSAASAAASVYALDRLFGTDLSNEELIALASYGEIASGGTPHADNVAGCLLGGFVFIRRYDPPQFSRIEVGEIPIVMGVLRKSQKTTRGLIQEKMGMRDVREQSSLCASVIHAFHTHDLKALGAAINRDLISEPVRSRFIPSYESIKKELLAAGAHGVNVSGGGSSIFAICQRDTTASVADILTRQFQKNSLNGEVLITRAGNQGLCEMEKL